MSTSRAKGLKSQATKIRKQSGLQDSVFSDHVPPEDTLEFNCYWRFWFLEQNREIASNVAWNS